MILKARFLSWKKYLCKALQIALLFLVQYTLIKYKKTHFLEIFTFAIFTVY